MGGNVAALHAAPLPTNVKPRVADSSIQLRWGGWARRGRHKCVRRILKEGSNNGTTRPLTNISSRSEDFRYLRTGCLAGKPLDGSSLVEMP
jgi:hypothetical protein